MDRSYDLLLSRLTLFLFPPRIRLVSLLPLLPHRHPGRVAPSASSLWTVFLSHTRWAAAFPHHRAKLRFLSCSPAALQWRPGLISRAGESRDVKGRAGFSRLLNLLLRGRRGETLFLAMNLWIEDFMKFNPHCYSSIILLQVIHPAFPLHLLTPLPHQMPGAKARWQPAQPPDLSVMTWRDNCRTPLGWR